MLFEGVGRHNMTTWGDLRLALSCVDLSDSTVIAVKG